MEEKIKLFVEETIKGHINLELYEELNGSSIVEYMLENNQVNDLKYFLTPQIFDDGLVRILFDPFSDDVYDKLTIYLNQKKDGIKEFIDSLYKIDYDKLFQIKLKDSRARRISGMGFPVRNEKNVIYYAEPACLQSMLKLFDLNIDTWANDTEGVFEDGNFKPDESLKCGINIYYSRLSEENKQVIKRLIENGIISSQIGDYDTIFIYVNCKREETIGEISNRLLEVISQLKIQDVKSWKCDEENINDLLFNIYNKKYNREKIPYSTLCSELIKYFEQFSIEGFPEREIEIQNIKDNLYTEESLIEYFHLEPEFKTQVLKNMIQSLSIDERIQELIEYGYYVDKENGLIFYNDFDYLRHQKYINSKQDKSKNVI